MTGEALQVLGLDAAGTDEVDQFLPDCEELSRRVVLDKIGSAGRQESDRLLLLAVDLGDRRY